MNNPETLPERLSAALAPPARHWGPVLVQWLENAAGWYAVHSGGDAPDPAIDEILEVVRAPVEISDFALADALAETEFARRLAVVRPAIRWSPFDGPYVEFIAALNPGTLSRTTHDVMRPKRRIRRELLGWLSELRDR